MSLIHLKTFENFLFEMNISLPKYPGVMLKDADDESYITDPEIKLKIIQKYFPFTQVMGEITFSGEDEVNLKFDTGFDITGKWEDSTDSLPSLFKIDGREYPFNFHPFGGLGGFATTVFEKAIQDICEQELAQHGEFFQKLQQQIQANPLAYYDLDPFLQQYFKPEVVKATGVDFNFL
jgi:hypothetical protein